MKQLITLFLAVFFMAGTQDIQAQTKEETELWINEKMDKLIKENIEVDFTRSGVVTFIINEFSLKDGMISMRYNRISSSSTVEVKATNTPINLMTVVKLSDNEFGVLRNHYLNIQFDSAYKNKLNIQYNNSRDSELFFGIYNIEENLAERLVTAFEHYKTFYPTPEKPKEAF